MMAFSKSWLEIHSPPPSSVRSFEFSKAAHALFRTSPISVEALWIAPHLAAFGTKN